ncbi:MAG: cell division protein FtsQ/DivIB [Rhodobacteraceae bacterium]|nr:cell division protein FtsQ/DivIB [Paracoccaceae bacterium]
MRSLRIDPSSRWGYRLQRIWLTPLFRALLRTGLPCLIVSAGILTYINQPHVKLRIAEAVLDAKMSLQERPEFMVKLMAIEGAAPEVAERIRGAVHVDFPISSFDLDLDQLRLIVEKLPPVQSATLRVRPGGVLEVGIIERTPALVWRRPEGLGLIDVEGNLVSGLDKRADRADLPLVVGEGAHHAAEEALELMMAAAPIADRVRGLRRMGERRWDVVLDRNQVIQLPEEAPVPALERVILLDKAQELLARNITHLDLRNPRRPTLRLAQSSLEELHIIRGLEIGVNVNE